MFQKVVCLSLLFFLSAALKSQNFESTPPDSSLVNYASPKEYEIGGIMVSGSDHLDVNVLKLLSGLNVGDKVQVPGDRISTAIENLWKQGLFEDIKITASKIQGKTIYINIAVTERPKLSKYTITGVKKGEADDLREKVKLTSGKVLTDGIIASALQKIKDFYIAKGYLDVIVTSNTQKDTKVENSAVLNINVKKGNKIKIKNINFTGVTAFKPFKMTMIFKETKPKKWWNPFNAGKLKEADYEKDKKALIDKYNEKGYRDAKIVRDSIYRVDNKHISIDVVVNEGHIYYFRNIKWIGNSKYPSKTLSNVLGIKKGDVYNQSQLNTKLFMNPSGNDVSSLYMDEGYLFFNLTPVETMATDDSIDLEMRIYEGKQATINKISIVGNSKTNDHVILREIRTQPGQLFRRSDVIRSQRELSQLGYFDPQKMNVTPIPNQANGTVDILYTVEEKPSDQIQLSGGYGGGRLVGTLGVTFTNFSARNFFKKEAWKPLPSGDGQRLSVQAQSSGLQYRSYNISFTEPWLGGKKPNSLSVSAYHSVQTNGLLASDPSYYGLSITGFSVGLGKRLKKPDDYFTLFQEIDYQYYSLHNYTSLFNLFSSGTSNEIYYKVSLKRNSLQGNPIFPSGGSQLSLSGQFTPPYSLFNHKNYSADLTPEERYRFVEFQKYKFTAKHFIPITNKRGSEGKPARNLILMAYGGFGFLTTYNSKTGDVPFERFYLGGSGLTGYTLGGREIIALRGYDDASNNSLGSVSPPGGGSFIAKYSMELRFPVSLNPQATVFLLAFTDAGNAWAKAKDFDPFNVKRSAGVGVRIFLPMFGLLGFDYGWRLDDANYGYQSAMQRSQFHFTIGATIGEL
jgi:outer membrane protein insertion porin family